jgi:hypothetical protein
VRAELRHLLDKLKAEREGFQSLVLYANGKSMAVFRWEPICFDSLDALEAWAYALAAAEPEPPKGGTPNLGGNAS